MVKEENILENEFVQKCISYIKLGIIPDYILNISLDFTPVDSTAKAIYKLVTHPNNKNRVFHLYNHKTVSLNTLLKAFRKSNYNVEVLSENNFKENINLVLQNENTKNLLNNLLNDFDENLHIDYTTDIKLDSNFTIKYLKKLNFRWPKIRKKYLIRFINLLRKVI